MSLPFDATLKDLAQLDPQGMLAVFDVPPTRPVDLLNIDLSTVTTSTDLVFGLGKPLEEIIHLDFQSSASATKHRDILVYNTLLFRQYEVPVHSIVVLLRPQAAHVNLYGSVVYSPRPDRGKIEFSYEVIKLWLRPATELLGLTIGMLPLAVLGKVAGKGKLATKLAPVIDEIIARLERDAPREKVARLETAAYILTGLRILPEIAAPLFKGAVHMRDSDTYMAILEEGRQEGRQVGRQEGRVEEVQKLILRLGERKLLAPDPKIRQSILALTDIERLETLLERVYDAKSWQELLASP